MFLKKFLLFGLIAAVLPAVAEEAADRKTATSLKYVTHELDTRQDKFGAEANKAMEYTNSAGVVEKRAVTSDLDNGGTDSLPMVGGVNTKLNTKQDDIGPVNDHTAVTYTGESGEIGQKGIYQATESFAEQSDNLIDAKTFNAALKTGLDNEFRCAETKPGTDICWVYSIHNNVGNVSPAEYTALEWIESDGTQYIDTGIKVSNLTDTVIDFQSNISGLKWLFGSRDYNSSGTPYHKYSLQFISSSSNKIWLQFDDTNELEYGALTSLTQAQYLTRHTVRYISGDVFIDNQQIFTLDRSLWTPFQSDRSLLLFTNYAKTGGVTSTAQFQGRCYGVEIRTNGTLEAKLIPAQHGTTVGMYDTVRQRFFPSAVSGTNFIAGPELNVYIPQGQ